MRLALIGWLVAAPCFVAAQTPSTHPLFAGPVRDLYEQPYDQQHLDARLQVDPAAGELRGAVTLTVAPLADSLPPLALFAAGLDVDSIWVGPLGQASRAVAFQFRGDTLWIDLAPDTLDGESSNALPTQGLLPPADAEADSLLRGGSVGMAPLVLSLVPGEPFDLRIRYTASPSRGLYFADGDAGGARAWTEPRRGETRYWLPLIDAPHDRLTSSIDVSAPEGLTVLASGQHLGTTADSLGRRWFRYAVDFPQPPEHLGFVAGAFTPAEAVAVMPRGRRVLTSLWTPDGSELSSEDVLTRMEEGLSFLSAYTNVPYQWPMYHAAHAPAAMTFGAPSPPWAYTGAALVDAGVGSAEPSVDDLEGMARQWFGVLVNAAPWTDAWLNGGLARYVALRRLAESGGAISLALRMDREREAYLEEARAYRRPLVWDRWEEPSDLLDVHNRSKGAWVAHMLHEALGDETFRAVLERYLTANAFEAVDSEALRAAVEAETGESWVSFFDQWVYSAGHPELDVSYEYDAAAGQLRLRIEQTQASPLTPPAFAFDLPIVIHTLAGTESATVEMVDAAQEASFPLAMPPRFVALDPEVRLLHEASVEQAASAWVAQLRYAESAALRQQAARRLVRFADDPALLIGLENAFESEPEPSVRAAITRTLDALPPTPAVVRALQAVLAAEPATVRAAAVNALADARGDATAEALAAQLARTDPNDAVIASAVEALASMGAVQAEEVVRAALITPSAHEVVRRAGVRAVLALDLAAAEKLRLLRPFTTPDVHHTLRIETLSALGGLASEPGAMQILRAALDAPSPAVRAAAVRALARSEEPEAKALIQSLVATEAHPQVRRALQVQQR